MAEPIAGKIGSIVVLGTGMMAPGIARACAGAASDVHVVGRNLARARDATRKASSARVSAAPLRPATFAGASLIIETIVEDLLTKQDVLARVERWVADDAVIVSNTSSIPIGVIAEALARPARFAGLHFLNPADATRVVEVVPGARTEASTLDTLIDLAGRMGKRPLVVRRDVPGFIWNRIQFAVLRECLYLLEEEIADIESIDAAVSDGLAPRWLAAGPLATADLGGLETFARSAAQLFSDLASGSAVSDELGRRAAGDRGFYEWTAEARGRLEELRRELLGAHGATAARRRDLTPAPAPRRP